MSKRAMRRHEYFKRRDAIIRRSEGMYNKPHKLLNNPKKCSCHRCCNIRRRKYKNKDIVSLQERKQWSIRSVLDDIESQDHIYDNWTSYLFSKTYQEAQEKYIYDSLLEEMLDDTILDDINYFDESPGYW